MSNDNEEGSGFCGCIILIVILFLVSYCISHNPVTIIDNSIEAVHKSINHVDSVWKGGKQ